MSRPTMRDLAAPLRFPATSCGCIAFDSLQDGNDGRVVAVLESSFYVRLADALVCVGNDALQPSPLSLVTTAPRGIDWSASGLRVDAGCRIRAATLYVGERCVFPLRGAALWRPQPPAGERCSEALRRGLAEFMRHTAARAPRAGLGRIVLCGSAACADEPTRNHARAAIADIRAWLAEAMRRPATTPARCLRRSMRLIGLGPGLTPSGDDFLAGVMIALHGFGFRRALEALWLAARPALLASENAVSLAHLTAASRGLGSDIIHRAFAALLAGERAAIASLVDAVDDYGHTSGWDTLAGLLSVAQARLRLRDESPGPAPCR